MALAFQGYFYEFHRERNISRPGQPIQNRSDLEIGPEISREDASRRVRNGKDVYTPNKGDAYKLALHTQNGRPVEHLPHRPANASPTGRRDVYFRHYHPGGLHPVDGGVGHIFFGERGESFEA